MKTILALIFLTTLSWAGVHDITETGIEGQPYPMSSLKGKVVLIVNIATQCGYTSQLEDLEKLYQKYKDKNFVVLGVPTNDFLWQTPEDDMKVKEFCQKNYQVSFPLLKKHTIKGKKMRPLFKYLTEEGSEKLRGSVGWNFEKFLVNKNGELVERFKSSVKPLSTDVVKSVEAQL